MKINYLTTNKLKFDIAKKFFDSTDEYELVQYSFSVPEVQDVSCEEIARQSAIHAAREIGEVCIVMDAGFFINALNGFPGPRTAYFNDALAVGFPDGTAKVFSHKTTGRLAKVGEYAPSNWPANSLFIPDGHSTPLGLMSEQEQADFRHSENRNWQKLTDFLLKR